MAFLLTCAKATNDLVADVRKVIVETTALSCLVAFLLTCAKATNDLVADVRKVIVETTALSCLVSDSESSLLHMMIIHTNLLSSSAICYNTDCTWRWWFFYDVY